MKIPIGWDEISFQKKTSVVVPLKKHFLILNWKTPINIQHELPFFHDFLKTVSFACFFPCPISLKTDGPPAAVSSLKFFCLRHRKFLNVNNFFWILRAPKELKSMCFLMLFVSVSCLCVAFAWMVASLERENMHGKWKEQYVNFLNGANPSHPLAK